MTRDGRVFYGCLAWAALSALALIALRNPASHLSQLCDHIDGNTNPTRKALR